ncbi:O-succinylbenzoic acid--CoA ligase [Raineyella antarctica]|uniref:O-succinylbenzoic acid--CoA ligase n=1 Tax=Raineyella antarctica TaxID=1577474 RepID=A0A1G6GHS5_9ACTN|nr:AMP-binding protein [Raineyella antarctica]SDB80726.1 O-succinylbenzoic acid--CoA ligase [Raineyella antarctica]
MSAPLLRPLPTAGLSSDELTDAFAGALEGSYVLAPLPPDPVEEAAVRRMLAAAEEPGALPEDVALVVSTSGSTGTPKGVMLSASAIRAAAAATDDRLSGPGEWTLALGPHYVAGAMVVCRALLADRALHLARTDLADLSATPARAGSPSYLSVVPTQLARLRQDRAALAALAGFDAILLGGAAVDPDLLAQLRDEGLRLVTTYGMSETCGGCVYDGRPLAGVGITVDPADQRVGITGPVLFSGYLGRPDLTAAALGVLPGPDGGPVLLTGDRGEVGPDGRLHLLGRIDDVVVSGGLNVDLAAVQAAARRAIGTTELVALGVPDEVWGTRVVVVTTARTSLAALRTALAADLSHQALPRGLSHVDVLPTTSSGKIDRRALLGAWESMHKELA